MALQMNTSEQTAYKLNEPKNFQILEIGTLRPISVKFIFGNR
jgi:hypothetical protein